MASLDERAILDQIQDSILVVDSSARVLQSNSAADETLMTLGRDKIEDAIRKLLGDDSTLRGGRAVRGVWWNFGPLTFLIDIFPATSPPSRFVMVLRDITRFRAMEDEFRREEVLIFLSKIAGEILHEMKGPLTGIKGAAQLLKEGFDADLLRILETETRRLEDMVLEMVEFSKPTDLAPAETNIHQVLDDSLSLFKGVLREKRIEVVRRYDPSLPPIPVDAEKIKRAVSNLIKNAIEASSENGRMSLSTRVAMNSIYTPGRNMVSIQIRDTGPGLPSGAENWLFSPHRSAKTHGLGLGLAIAYRIVKEHRGVIQYSPPSTFEILLPLRAA